MSEFHAIRLKGNNYALVPTEGGDVFIISAKDIGNYNVVSGVLDGDNLTIDRVKYGEETADGIVVKQKLALDGGATTIGLEYKCIARKLLSLVGKTDATELGQMHANIFGDQKTLKAFSLLDIGDTPITLLFNEKLKFMFLTSMPLPSLIPLTIVENGIEKVTDDEGNGIPMIHVKMKWQEYVDTKDPTVPMYILPMDMNLKDSKDVQGLGSKLASGIKGLFSRNPAKDEIVKEASGDVKPQTRLQDDIAKYVEIMKNEFKQVKCNLMPKIFGPIIACVTFIINHISSKPFNSASLDNEEKKNFEAIFNQNFGTIENHINTAITSLIKIKNETSNVGGLFSRSKASIASNEQYKVGYDDVITYINRLTAILDLFTSELHIRAHSHLAPQNKIFNQDSYDFGKKTVVGIEFKNPDYKIILDNKYNLGEIIYFASASSESAPGKQYTNFNKIFMLAHKLRDALRLLPVPSTSAQPSSQSIRPDAGGVAVASTGLLNGIIGAGAKSLADAKVRKSRRAK